MKNVSILDFGAAVSDRVQTAAIQNAIDACFLAGGGRVVIPCGVFLTGAVRLRSRVELYLESGAVLRGSRDPADYDSFRSDLLEPLPGKVPPGTARSADPLSRWSNGLIRAFDAEDIAVTGEKGSYFWGSDVYDPEGEEDYRGPHGFSFWNCRGVRFSGYTFLDSSNWCHALFGCQDITARNLAVYGGHDGFDVRTCDNVLIEDSLFHTGDDCIAGFDNHDVTVRNCDFQTACSVFRFGGNHVRVENCRSAGPSSFGGKSSRFPPTLPAATGRTPPLLLLRLPGRDPQDPRRYSVPELFLFRCGSAHPSGIRREAPVVHQPSPRLRLVRGMFF